MDTSNLFRLDGRVPLVTGGSRGIGKMIAAGFIAQGAKVYISSRKAAACEAAVAELGPSCIALPQDISTVAGCQALAAQFTALEPQLAILVNNAGGAVRGLSGKWLGQGHGPLPEIAVFPDAGASCGAESVS